MTQVQKAPKVWDWAIQYSFPQMVNQIQTVAHCDMETMRLLYPNLEGQGWSNGHLKEWKVMAEISSLQEAPFPNLADEATNDQRLASTLQVEWGSPRFHFCLWMTKKTNPSPDPSVKDWVLEGKHSIIHAFGYPFRIYYPFDILTNNITRDFQDGTRFGFSIDDVGYGYPSTEELPFDIITTSGNWVQELFLLSPDPQPVVIYISGASGGTNTPTPSTPPSISGTPTTDVLLASSTNISFEISNLAAAISFTIELLRGSITAKTDTFQTAGTTTTYTYNVNPTTYIANGTAAYKVKVTQGSLGAESTAFNMVQPKAQILTSSISKASSSNVAVRVSNLISGQTYQLRWVYLTPNQTDVTQTFDYTYNPPVGQAYEDRTFPGTTFANYFNGYSAPNTYKIRIKSSGSTPVFDFLNSEILNVTN